MTFDVRLHLRVDGFIDKLERLVAERIRKKLRMLKEDPFRFLEHHEGAGVFKLRIAQHRALVDVDTKRRIVYVRHLDHRKRIYKKKAAREMVDHEG